MAPKHHDGFIGWSEKVTYDWKVPQGKLLVSVIFLLPIRRIIEGNINATCGLRVTQTDIGGLEARDGRNPNV